MQKQNRKGLTDKGSWIKMLLVAGVALVLVTVFGPKSPPPDTPPPKPEDCFSSVLADGKNLNIIGGPRTKTNILHDLAPLICRGRTIFNKLKAEGEPLSAGTVILQLAVEFNGEIISIKIQETSIESKSFLNELTNLFAMSDFSFWNREDEDAVFTYTASFGR